MAHCTFLGEEAPEISDYAISFPKGASNVKSNGMTTVPSSSLSISSDTSLPTSRPTSNDLYFVTDTTSHIQRRLAPETIETGSGFDFNHQPCLTSQESDNDCYFRCSSYEASANASHLPSVPSIDLMQLDHSPSDLPETAESMADEDQPIKPSARSNNRDSILINDGADGPGGLPPFQIPPNSAPQREPWNDAPLKNPGFFFDNVDSDTDEGQITSLPKSPSASRECSINEGVATAKHMSNEQYRPRGSRRSSILGSENIAKKPTSSDCVIKDDRDLALLWMSDDESFSRDDSVNDTLLPLEELSSCSSQAPSIEDSVKIPSNLNAKPEISDTPRRHNLSGSNARRRSTMVERRNPEIEVAMEKLDMYHHDGITLRENVTVELDDEDFLRIITILQSTKTGAVFVRGHTFRRTRYMNGIFNNKRNEVCWIQELDDDDPRPSGVQSMDTVSIAQVIKRRGLRFTNQAYPALNYLDDKGWIIPHGKHSNKKVMYEFIDKNAPLTCRMKFVRYFKDARARRRNACHEKAVYFLRQDECDNGPDNKISDLQLRQIWRGKTEKGGAQVGLEPGEKEFLRQEALSHAGRQCNNSLLISNRKYEPGDVMARGAVGDLLIRDDDAGVIYQKLSGVNDACFTRSTLNVVTGKEVNDMKFSNDELKMKMKDALRDFRSEGGASYLTDDNRRLETRSSSPRQASEVIEIDAHWRKTTDDTVYQQQIEGKIKSTICPRLRETYKRTASEAFPFPTETSAPDLRRNPKDESTIDLTDVTCLSSGAESPFGDTTMLKPFDPTSYVPCLSASASTLGGMNDTQDCKPAIPYASNDAPAGSFSHSNTVVHSLRKKPKTIQRRYTFGDCFCGAGGMSRGAVMAGMRVKWGFDFNDIACYSYALNFIGARVYHEQANIFATSKANQKVDVCHISPSCKYFSPAHTRPGRDDDENIASFFAVGELLKKTRCRIAVLEQTAGLMNRHELYFHYCVREFADQGFSVRWRIVNCADYGLPQRRMRLFMIASWYAYPFHFMKAY